MGENKDINITVQTLLRSLRLRVSAVKFFTFLFANTEVGKNPSQQVIAGKFAGYTG